MTRSINCVRYNVLLLFHGDKYDRYYGGAQILLISQRIEFCRCLWCSIDLQISAGPRVLPDW